MGKSDFPRSPRPEYLYSGIQDSGRRVLGIDSNLSKASQLTKPSSFKSGKKQLWFRKHLKQMALTLGIMAFVFLLDSLVFSVFNPASVLIPQKEKSSDLVNNGSKVPIQMYDRLLNLASRALAEKKVEADSLRFLEEDNSRTTTWRPCANRKTKRKLGKAEKNNGYILVSANGGLNQQRVAVCNAVAVASLLNATLVIPKFLFSNVWKDPSQFGDIYQEEYFINILKDEVKIVKELPSHLKSLEFKAIGSLITDAVLPKEATLDDYNKIVLPPLLKNGVIHLLGYGNRLGFDPIPSHLQRLRCKCNFHALKFVPKIQSIGLLLIKRMRKYDGLRNNIDKELIGNFSTNLSSKTKGTGVSKYLALHLRFEIDMVAYSQCEFGGGEKEKKELQDYRESHFALLIERLKNSELVSASELRMLGKCPLTPEEAALVLAGIGVKRKQLIYLAGSSIYGGQSRMHPLTSLYPNLITKENLLTFSELEPFRKFSSQLAALDFIACAAADVFAMTDSGSQLSSLVTGFRVYYGDGHASTLRPSKKRLAAILSENSTIKWGTFENRIRKMVQETQRVHLRPYGKSIYRQPRCTECMCKY